MALRPTSYVPHRWAIYSLLWCVSVIELALTAFRIRHTESLSGTHDPIVAELLATSIFTILWIPATLLLHRSAGGLGGTGTGAGTTFSPRHGETGGNLVLWIMWLVGAAIATHTWPTRAVAAAAGEENIITALVAFAWIAFGLLTIAKIFGLMEYSAIRAWNAGGYGGAYPGGRGVGEKPIATGAAPGTTNGTTAAGAGPGATV